MQPPVRPETTEGLSPFMKIAFAPGVIAIVVLVLLLLPHRGVAGDVTTESAAPVSTTAAPPVSSLPLASEVESGPSETVEPSAPSATAFTSQLQTDDYPFLRGSPITEEAQIAAATARAAESLEAQATVDALAATESTAGGTNTAPASVAQPIAISSPPCGTLNGATNRTAPFTGLSASIPASMPAVVVKVSNNSSTSRSALIGLDQADIIFEERIEGSATRFFSVFHSSLPENVGPVRSGRTTDIQLTENLNNPIFGYSGSNQGIARQINFAASNNLLRPYVNTDRSPFARDSRWRAPDNLFVSPAGLGACGTADPTAIFSYGSNNSGTAQAASSVSFSARSSFRFDWNGSTWTRSQSGSQHVTRDGEALDPTNVVVLFVPYTQSQIDSNSVDAVTVGSGEAWVLRDGTITTGGYARERGHDPYTLTDGNGSAINLAAGQTWVVLAPAGTASFG